MSDPVSTVMGADTIVTAVTSLGGMAGIIGYFINRDKEQTKREREKEDKRVVTELEREKRLADRINLLEDFQRDQILKLTERTLTVIAEFSQAVSTRPCLLNQREEN